MDSWQEETLESRGGTSFYGVGLSSCQRAEGAREFQTGRDVSNSLFRNIKRRMGWEGTWE